MSTRIPDDAPSYCPYSDCGGKTAGVELSPPSGHRVRRHGIVRKGHYWRAEDARWIRRYRCLKCRRSFSSSRWTPFFRQKKRRLNQPVAQLLVNGTSERAAGRMLRINRKTVTRKWVLMSGLAKQERLAELVKLALAPQKLGELQFDEMESFERSKCLPLSIPLAVTPERKILSFRVVSMPAKGPLALISRKKYGPRRDDRKAGALELFSEILAVVDPNALFKTDQKSTYPGWIRARFPRARHKAFKGKRGCVVGQGELKKVFFDPLFSFNHTAAMLRANINRLFRRTWCTTKRPDRLAAHIELYIQAHNRRVEQQLLRKAERAA